ncbi:MAG: hypothetical protein HFH94_16440 [Lachnospiraceae bacterium]|nr:hypothetical protein [Lachnospiraceae bacterium]
MTESTEKTWKAKIIFQAVFCSLTVILTVLYALGIQSISLTTVNVLCLSFYFTQLAPGLIDHTNQQKAQWLLAAVFISASVTSLNLWVDYQTLGQFRLNALSGWCLTWMLLLLVASISTINILIRLFRWSQEQWEQIRKIRQEHRQKSKESRIAYSSSRSTHRLDILGLSQRHRKELRESKQKSRLERLALKAQLQKDRLLLKLSKGGPIKEENPKGESSYPDMPGSFSMGERAILVLLACIAIGIFLLLPFFNTLGGAISTWLDAIKNFNESLFSKKFENISEALLYYMLFYIAIALFIGALCYLIYRMINGKKDKKEPNITALAEQYSTPVAILIVFGAFLFVLTNGNFDTEWVNQEWIVLFLIILVILVLLTAIEIVRLVITQCAEPHSLLKQLIYLIFIAVLRFLSEILLGVIVNFRIQATISSLLTFLFPDSDDSASSFYHRLNTKINCLFNDAVSGQADVQQNASELFHRKRIWRRYKK